MHAMAPVLVARVLDGGRPNLDGLGISYVTLAILYTIVVSGELYLLFRNRSEFCVRIRNIRVIFSAVSMLHIYLILVLLVYPWNGLFPCSAEFWIMSVFLPSGIALFQACNARVLKAYETQRRLRRNFLEVARKKRITVSPRGLYDAWLDLDATEKVYTGTVVALIISFIFTVVLFIGSRRFHATYGFGPAVDAMQCRRGAEWIPSIFVQLFWTAMVGPWILWKIRRVHDVHYWAWQTRLAVVAGLPGTPLWMAFTYGKIPGMLSINKYFAPAGWFLPSLVVCQQVLIIIPLRDAFKTKSRGVLESRSPSTLSSSTNSSLTTPASFISKKISQTTISSKDLKSKASMQALEFSIEHSIEPLIAWAAAREFTAENTIFLREVRNFKKKWGPLLTVTTAQRRQMFTEASLIFFTLINPFTAETPINIAYKDFRSLQKVFENVEFDPYMRSGSPVPHKDNVVCPWEDVLDERPTSIESTGSAISTASTRSFVPSEFTECVFDQAFESIKYLVFTNTWPRFVEAGVGELEDSPTTPP